MQRGIDQGKLLNKRISSKFSLVFDCVGHLVSDVAENKLVWEMSELITEIAGLICPVISEEDSDHGVRLDDGVRRDNCQPPHQPLPSLINKITGDTDNVCQQLGRGQFGNQPIRKPDNHSQHRHGQSGLSQWSHVCSNVACLVLSVYIEEPDG